MKKTVIALLAFVPTVAFGAEVYSNVGAMANKVVASVFEGGTFAEFANNPVPGECGTEYTFPADNAAMAKVLGDSKLHELRVILTISDPFPNVLNRCSLNAVNSLE